VNAALSLALALELADLADALTLPAFLARDFVVETKPDLTPVTATDRTVEQALRARVAQDRPEDAFLGEEHGQTGQAGTRWIVDPIDGTRNFSRSIPIWATLIAVETANEIVAGVASAPALGHRWWACAGGGAFVDGRSLNVSRVSRLDDAAVSLPPAMAAKLHGRVWHTRGLGDFWQHMLVAEGALDACADPGLELWDTAAVSIVVQEAGGRFTDLSGRDGPHGGSGVSSNGLVHEDLLAALV
jgi:histidinol-phosphatase